MRALRAFVEVEFASAEGIRQRVRAFVDSGAPFSVVPYTFWNGRKMPWQSLGTQFLINGVAVPRALTWQGVPCQFGEAVCALTDPATGAGSRLLTLRAKFPVAPTGTSTDGHILLGCGFFVDNDLSFLMEGTAGQLRQILLVP